MTTKKTIVFVIVGSFDCDRTQPINFTNLSQAHIPLMLYEITFKTSKLSIEAYIALGMDADQGAPFAISFLQTLETDRYSTVQYATSFTCHINFHQQQITK
jgi:hypothetical protein